MDQYNKNQARFVCSGYASFYTQDSVRDMIKPGAFTKYCKQNMSIPLLYEHKKPIGFVKIGIETAKGLWVQVIITDTESISKMANTEISEKMILSHYFSIGFRAQSASLTQQGRVLEDIDLVEISLVRHPAHKNARIYSCEALGTHTKI